MKALFTKIISVVILIYVILYLIIADKNKIKIIMETINKKHIIINFILVFICYIFINFIINNDRVNLININKEEHKQLITSCNLALFGFIIALFAHLDLLVAPFWFIFIASSVFNFKM
jgi:hypothetical protein